MFFGKKIKELRLKYCKKGLRNFAKAIDILSSYYCNIEKGHEEYPRDEAWYDNLILEIGVPPESEDELELRRLWKEPFVMQEMPENIYISPMTHKSDGSKLTGDEYIKLNNYITSLAKEHNKKAKEYNGR